MGWLSPGAALALIFLLASTGPSRLLLAQSDRQIDPSAFLLPPEDLPAGFEHQPERDRTLEEAAVVRALRFYTRGAPEVPTADHASILMAASVSDSAEDAAMDFQQTVLTWTQMGYELSELGAEPTPLGTSACPHHRARTRATQLSACIVQAEASQEGTHAQDKSIR